MESFKTGLGENFAVPLYSSIFVFRLRSSFPSQQRFRGNDKFEDYSKEAGADKKEWNSPSSNENTQGIFGRETTISEPSESGVEEQSTVSGESTESLGGAKSYITDAKGDEFNDGFQNLEIKLLDKSQPAAMRYQALRQITTKYL